MMAGALNEVFRRPPLVVLAKEAESDVCSLAPSYTLAQAQAIMAATLDAGDAATTAQEAPAMRETV